MNSITSQEFFAGLIASFSFLYSGFHLAFSTEYIYELNTNESTSTSLEEDSWIGSSGILLSFVGSLMQGYLADKYGRKILLYLTYSIFFVGWLIISLTTYVIGGRILISIAAGLSFSIMIYTIEIVRPDGRGVFSMFNAFAETLGILCFYVMAEYISVKGISFYLSIFALIFLVSTFYIPETPYWYLLKNQRTNAIKSVMWLRGAERDLAEKEIHLIEQNLGDTNENSLTFFETIFNLNWWRFFLIFSIYITLVEFTGCDVISAYTLQIFALINKTGIDDRIILILFAATLLVGTAISMIVIKKFERKKMAVYYFLINAILLIIIYYCQTYSSSFILSIISLICIFIYGAMETVVVTSLSWTIISESLPTELRATVFSALCAGSFLLYFFMVKLVPFTPAYYFKYLWLLCSIFSLFSAGFVIFFMKETRDIALPKNQKF